MRSLYVPYEEVECQNGPDLCADAAMTGFIKIRQIPTNLQCQFRLAEVTLIRISGRSPLLSSILPIAQAALSFKSSGYVTNIRQVVGADDAAGM